MLQIMLLECIVSHYILCNISNAICKSVSHHLNVLYDILLSYNTLCAYTMYSEGQDTIELEGSGLSLQGLPHTKSNGRASLSGIQATQ